MQLFGSFFFFEAKTARFLAFIISIIDTLEWGRFSRAYWNHCLAPRSSAF